jgi:hypothetical protein
MKRTENRKILYTFGHEINHSVELDEEQLAFASPFTVNIRGRVDLYEIKIIRDALTEIINIYDEK